MKPGVAIVLSVIVSLLITIAVVFAHAQLFGAPSGASAAVPDGKPLDGSSYVTQDQLRLVAGQLTNKLNEFDAPVYASAWGSAEFSSTKPHTLRLMLEEASPGVALVEGDTLLLSVPGVYFITASVQINGTGSVSIQIVQGESVRDARSVYAAGLAVGTVSTTAEVTGEAHTKRVSLRCPTEYGIVMPFNYRIVVAQI